MSLRLLICFRIHCASLVLRSFVFPQLSSNSLHR